MSTIQASTTRFDWQRFPATDTARKSWVEEFLQNHHFAATLAQRMLRETATRFEDWVDHIVLSEDSNLTEQLETLGYARDPLSVYPTHTPIFRHHGGMFPAVALVPARTRAGRVVEVALKVDSVADFCRAHDLGAELEGYAMGPYRRVRMQEGALCLSAVERHGYLGFDPWDGEMARRGRLAPHAARDALAARDLWHARKRHFHDDAAGFDTTEALLERVIELCHNSTDLACDLVFQAERAYWQSRNTAGRIQKARQDRLGLGWANHDHHTFRCSRRHFRRAIGIFERLGFELREAFHAGNQAGWGAQVIEHPVTGIVIFADLDLAPEEVQIDFAHQPLPELPRPNTVGLWVGLHGESLLDAGMHHLEAQFDFDALQQQLQHEAGIQTMPPFSNFSFLKQAFTQGEQWPVSPERANRVLEWGWIDAAQHALLLEHGAIGSHLENLERRDGYKGFNQKGVSAILAETDPRNFLTQ